MKKNKAHSLLTQYTAILLCLLQCVPFLLSGKNAHAFSISDEAELGRKYNTYIQARYPIILDPVVTTYLNSLTQRLLQSAPPQPFTFHTSAVRNNVVNAYAIPGGYLFIHSGLIINMQTESQLVSVLAHEVAHATQRHIASRIERMQTISILALLAGIAGAFAGGEGGEAAIVGSQAATAAASLNYSRLDEADADEKGLQYLIKAGFNPLGMPEAFNILRQKSLSVGSNVPGYLLTHPEIHERIGQSRLKIEQLPKEILQRPKSSDEFYKVQCLVRAYYSDSKVAERYFAQQKQTDCYALMGLAITQSLNHKTRLAEATFEKALQCSPDNQLILREMGRFHAIKGDAVKARLYLGKALDLNPQDTVSMFYKARLLTDLNQYQEAIPLFKNVLRFLPEEAEMHNYYGKALGMSGNQCEGYIELAYGALYALEKGRIIEYRNQAERICKTVEQQKLLKKFDATYTERRQFFR